METQPNLFFTLLPLIVLIVPTAIIGYVLAKEKGRNVAMWTLLGCIPFISMFCVWYFIGAANENYEKKLNAILQKLEEQSVG